MQAPSHYSAPAPSMRAPMIRDTRRPSPTLTIDEISAEEAIAWDAYARTRPGFEIVG